MSKSQESLKTLEKDASHLPMALTLQKYMKESSKENNYHVSGPQTARNNLRRKNPSIQSYSRSRPYGRDSITTNTDPLEKLKQIAGYDNHSRSQSFSIFDPETMEHGKDCKYF